MNLSKSIDFLLENAGPVIQYRLKKEILQTITNTNLRKSRRQPSGKSAALSRFSRCVVDDDFPDSYKAEEEDLLAQIYQLPYFKLVESYAKPNGFIGEGIHGFTNWRGVRFHETPFQDGESAAKLLVYYGIPKNHPLVTALISAYRSDDVLHEEYSKRPPAEYRGFMSRAVGLRQGGGLDTLL
ncbi:MAG: hypothetical protein FWC92_11040 [Defluviitaleaceae bacterium]|nr:hypothetical protein [Defluviitaleaceae bacterium]